MSLSFVAVLVFTACEDFEDLNTNPNEPVAVPSANLMTDVERNMANRLYSTFNGFDMGSCWVQHISKVQYNDEERYSPRQSVIEANWDVTYEDVISDARTMELLAIDEGNPAVQGAAIVLQAFGYAYLTDSYGDIPLTEAMQASNANFTPAYDDQEVVYDSLFAMLDRADALLASGSGSISASFDILYGGDATKWRKFANSLKFRTAMRVSGVQDVSAILTELMSRPMFTSSADEAKLVYLAAQPNANPIYETVVFGARGEFKLAEPLVTTLTTLGDPRLSVYVGPNDAGEYRGKPAGIQNVPNDDYNYNNVSPIGDFYLQPENPGYFLAYGELLFLMAEAADRNLITASATDLYNSAVTEAMRASGITTGVDVYLAQGSVAFSSENIQLQKWIALFTQGVEAWTEWRRTGIPSLDLALDGNPAVTVIPRRLSYPATEQTTNKANYDAAVASQGADVLITGTYALQ